jgi:reverse gyrase
VNDPGVTARVCVKCGGPIEQKRMGRPRKFCAHCTPRSDEDKLAAREHRARVALERRRRHSEQLRESERRWRERIRAGRQAR